ncbi:RNA polymerase-associated protein CTR9 [Chionoecetes opilio]|uniref:RNA polymerase-associated protein CTR9 n=1 Tax=Chionoecetes opilio TaxID=41210 RepID=A0A8J4XTD9_CHIOP|nr:RNA polymerase-associated protein CTR9 [Chionoecetes opilio]
MLPKHHENFVCLPVLANYDEAHKYFQEAWDRCESEKEQDLQYYSAIAVTIKYNTSRLHEMFCQYDKAEKLYKEILQDHPNYVDCKFMKVLCWPTKATSNEARDIFAQVREATAEFSDVWMNIAHIYVEQRQYINAIQMYENCQKKFFKYPNVEFLAILPVHTSKCSKLKEAKYTLLKIIAMNLKHGLKFGVLYSYSPLKGPCPHVAPHDTVILYNLPWCCSGWPCRYFQHLSANGDRLKYDLGAAAAEANQCRDLLSQAQYHVVRARKQDDEEKALRRKQDEERHALKQKVVEEQLKKEERRKQLMEEKVSIVTSVFPMDQVTLVTLISTHYY